MLTVPELYSMSRGRFYDERKTRAASQTHIQHLTGVEPEVPDDDSDYSLRLIVINRKMPVHVCNDARETRLRMRERTATVSPSYS